MVLCLVHSLPSSLCSRLGVPTVIRLRLPNPSHRQTLLACMQHHQNIAASEQADVVSFFLYPPCSRSPGTGSCVRVCDSRVECLSRQHGTVK